MQRRVREASRCSKKRSARSAKNVSRYNNSKMGNIARRSIQLSKYNKLRN